MSKRTGNGRKQQLAAARLLKQMNGMMGNSKHCNMHNHFSFSFLAEQTDPLSGRGDSMLSVSHRQGNNNKKEQGKFKIDL